MSFRQRVMLFSTAAIMLVVALTASVLGWHSRQTMIQEAERYGELIAQVLARSAGAAEQIPERVESILADHMLAQAHLVAEWVAMAESGGLAPERLRERLQALTQKSVIEEVWVTDSFGEAYLNSAGVDGFIFNPDATIQPQAYAFWDLLTGDAQQVVQRAIERDMDHQVFKYVGVTGVDKPRIVEVGLSVARLHEIEQMLGLEFMVQNLVADGYINAIWVFSSSLETLAWSSVLGQTDGHAPDADEIRRLDSVFRSGESESWIRDGHLVVLSPIPDEENQPQGVTLLRLSLDGLEQAQQRSIHLTLTVALLVMLLGALAAYFLARRVTQPIVQIGEAVRAVEQGAFAQVDLTQVGKRSDELGKLARVFESMSVTVGQREAWLDEQVRQRTQELESKNQLLAQVHQRVQDELSIAQSFQMAILPSRFPDFGGCLDAYGAMRSAREMGGDFYDVFALDTHRVGLVMADVSGKGVPAAFFMAICRTELQNLALQGGAPAQVLAQLNQRLLHENPLELFLTVFYAVLDTRTGVLEYANAGHNPPLLLSRGETSELAQAKGMVLGMLDGVKLMPAQHLLHPGDQLLLYTDGITEAFNAQWEAYGEARLIAWMSRQSGASAQGVCQDLLAEVDAFVAGAEQSDDQTLLSLVWFEGVSARFDASLTQLHPFTAWVEHYCHHQACLTARRQQIVLALDELFTNSVQYGFTDDARDQGFIEVSLAVQDGCLYVQLVDNGRAFDPTLVQTADTNSPLNERAIGGLGLFFVRQIARDWSYDYRSGFNRSYLTIQLEREEV